jgi:3-methyl-2-oxobutanoate hydroxymethyltransferase
MAALDRRITMADLRAARASRQKFAMLTCYDFTTARLMQEAGVPGLLVGDSAASVILGHSSTIPAKLDFLIELTAAVRRGAPLAMVWADMPFGTYHRSTAQGVRNVCRMVQLSGADAVKIESAATQLPMVSRLADAGVAVVAHLGLRPQFIGRLGQYKAQGRSAPDAMKVVELSQRFERAGAAAILLEAVPPEVSAAVVAAVDVPVIGCGAGPACHGHVVVTHDAVRLTTRKPRFVPDIADLATPARDAYERYVRLITEQAYPGPEHVYEMPADERTIFVNHKRTSDGV